MPNWREDKAILTLAFFTVFFALITLTIVWFRPSDGQTYQTFVSLLSGFVGAILLHLSPQKVPPAGSTTTSDFHQESKVPSVKVEVEEKVEEKK